MSNSDLFPLQDYDDHKYRPLSFLEECRASPSDQEDDNSDHHPDHDHYHEVLGQPHEEDHDHHDQEIMTKIDEAKKKEEEEVMVLIPCSDEERPKTAPSLLGKLDVKLDSDDDGFKTPTSLDHKIPMMQQCPPAPQKPKISSKRKAAPSCSDTSTACGILQLDFSEQIESMFPDLQCRRKIKKARRADQEAE